MKASESIRKNRRDYVTRPNWKPPYFYQQQPDSSGVVNAPRLDLLDPLPGESCESVPESESADRQAEEKQAR